MPNHPKQFQPHRIHLPDTLVPGAQGQQPGGSVSLEAMVGEAVTARARTAQQLTQHWPAWQGCH